MALHDGTRKISADASSTSSKTTEPSDPMQHSLTDILRRMTSQLSAVPPDCMIPHSIVLPAASSTKKSYRQVEPSLAPRAGSYALKQSSPAESNQYIQKHRLKAACQTLCGALHLSVFGQAS